MEKRTINPTDWLLNYGINHGIEIKGNERTLYLSGQTASDKDGAPMYPGDITAQFKCAWENLLAALKEADMEPSNIVRLNFYTTDVDALMSNGEACFGLIASSGCIPTSTLVGVDRLYDPSILIELEATAVA